MLLPKYRKYGKIEVYDKGSVALKIQCYEMKNKKHQQICLKAPMIQQK